MSAPRLYQDVIYTFRDIYAIGALGEYRSIYIMWTDRAYPNPKDKTYIQGRPKQLKKQWVRFIYVHKTRADTDTDTALSL